MTSLLRIVTDSDTTPPGTPSILSVTPVGQGRLDIVWSVAVDTGGAGLAGYNLQIDGSTLVTLGVQTSYSHTGLATSSVHAYRVQSRDANGNTSPLSTPMSGTAAGAPAVYNPNYPRFGSYGLGGTQNPTDAALAQNHVNIVVTRPGFQQSKGVSWATKCANVKALSTIGTKIFPYTIYPEIPDRNATVGEAFWEVWQAALTNNWWVFTNGLTETTKIPSYEPDEAWSKLNYTTAGKLVNGENFGQWKMRWDYKLNVQGGTFFNGLTNLTVSANPTGFDGTFFDNVFAQERTATTGATGDYDRNGTQDVLTSAASKLLIQSSHAALADFYQTLHPGAYVLANSADWSIYYPSGISTTPLNQKFHGGLMEHAQRWDDGTYASSMSELMTFIQVQMNGYQPPKLGVLSVLVSSATNYASLRYWHCINALVDTYYYPHTTETLLAQELGNVPYDERTFQLGAASDNVQTTARYQAGANGAGIYRRDFANGIVLVAARGSSYSAQSLGGTFYRLNGPLDPTTNNGAAVTSVTMTAGTGLVLSRTPTTATGTGFTPTSGVTALSGTFAPGQSFTFRVNGGGNGAGPTVTLYSDFRGGADNADIPTTAPRIGQFTGMQSPQSTSIKTKYRAGKGFDGNSCADTLTATLGAAGQWAQMHLDGLPPFDSILIQRLYKIDVTDGSQATTNQKDIWISRGVIDTGTYFNDIYPGANQSLVGNSGFVYYFGGSVSDNPGNDPANGGYWRRSIWNYQEYGVKPHSGTATQGALADFFVRIINPVDGHYRDTCTNKRSPWVASGSARWDCIVIPGDYQDQVPSHTGATPHATFQYTDDLLINTGVGDANAWKRCFLGNASTLSACTKAVPVLVTSWGDEDITVQLPYVDTSTLNGWHLYQGMDANTIIRRGVGS